jgi:hypothetical protein
LGLEVEEVEGQEEEVGDEGGEGEGDDGGGVVAEAVASTGTKVVR